MWLVPEQISSPPNKRQQLQCTKQCSVRSGSMTQTRLADGFHLGLIPVFGGQQCSYVFDRQLPSIAPTASCPAPFAVPFVRTLRALLGCSRSPGGAQAVHVLLHCVMHQELMQRRLRCLSNAVHPSKGLRLQWWCPAMR